jgi:hypothetical protein
VEREGERKAASKLGPYDAEWNVKENVKAASKLGPYDAEWNVKENVRPRASSGPTMRSGT